MARPIERLGRAARHRRVCGEPPEAQRRLGPFLPVAVRVDVNAEHGAERRKRAAPRQPQAQEARGGAGGDDVETVFGD